MDHLKIARAHFLGLSMGGMVGQHLGLDQPQRFASLILSSTSSRIPAEAQPLWDERVKVAREKGMGSQVPVALQRWLAEAARKGNPALVARMTRYLETTPVEGYVGWCQAIRTLNITDRLKGIKLPTRVIVGAEDSARRRPRPRPSTARLRARTWWWCRASRTCCTWRSRRPSTGTCWSSSTGSRVRSTARRCVRCLWLPLTPALSPQSGEREQRVLVLGGYGAFGALVAERLARVAGIEVIAAGRSQERAQSFAARLAAAGRARRSAASRLDAARHLRGVLGDIRPAVLINATGPYPGPGLPAGAGLHRGRRALCGPRRCAGVRDGHLRPRCGGAPRRRAGGERSEHRAGRVGGGARRLCPAVHHAE